MSGAPTSRRAGSTGMAVRTRRATANNTTTTTTTTTTAGYKTHQKQRISLAGSTAVISDYFHYAINAILYQRAIYDQADFKIVKKFGLQMMLVEDESIAQYLTKITDQVKVWLTEGKINRLVLVIQRQDTRETIERWEFDVHVEGEEEQQQQEGEGASSTASNTTTDQPAASTAAKKPGTSTKPKTLAQVQTEIQKIIRQIIATVSFLPIPDTPRTFKVLAHTHSVGQDEATEWNDSEAFDITERAERVKLKSFSTAVHRVDTAVDYKLSAYMLSGWLEALMMLAHLIFRFVGNVYHPCTITI
ncbi:hypothetical protein PCASD_07152 [Puccinia coronata f. sp. avenae]|uniref:HORMA domain-containing protein n=1 Tax=Puccinia coronata f. sp. avenae TaxID=200324 RepID=A0A2N5V469_9BASI|nr:hypothetical protein PCASD_07152 [Puccinia coronata f. sp. avenae]